MSVLPRLDVVATSALGCGVALLVALPIPTAFGADPVHSGRVRRAAQDLSFAVAANIDKNNTVIGVVLTADGVALFGGHPGLRRPGDAVEVRLPSGAWVSSTVDAIFLGGWTTNLPGAGYSAASVGDQVLRPGDAVHGVWLLGAADLLAFFDGYMATSTLIGGVDSTLMGQGGLAFDANGGLVGFLNPRGYNSGGHTGMVINTTPILGIVSGAPTLHGWCASCALVVGCDQANPGFRVDGQVAAAPPFFPSGRHLLFQPTPGTHTIEQLNSNRDGTVCHGQLDWPESRTVALKP